MTGIFIRFNYTLLRNEAHVEYNETASKLIEQFDPSTLGISDEYETYRSLVKVETGALDLIRKSEYTTEIRTQDQARTGVFRGLAAAIRSACNHFDPLKRRAAERIELVIKHYGSVTTKALDQKTAAIDDLLRELTGAHSDDVQLLSLDEWLTPLAAENRQTKTLMSNRYAEIARRPQTRMKPARAQTDRALRNMLRIMEALAAVNSPDPYTPLARELNAVSDRYKNQIAQSAGRKAKIMVVDN
jgi:hypothetical protein